MMTKGMLLLGALALAIATFAQTLKTDPGHNNPPPLGVILDPSGTPIPGHGDGSTFQFYLVNFAATTEPSFKIWSSGLAWPAPSRKTGCLAT
jgi:hypothetical protein